MQVTNIKMKKSDIVPKKKKKKKQQSIIFIRSDLHSTWKLHGINWFLKLKIESKPNKKKNIIYEMVCTASLGFGWNQKKIVDGEIALLLER